MKLTPNAILELLETNAVLLPIRKGTKAPYQKNWQSLTFDKTQTSQHQASLNRAGAIGVLLGSASGNLCSIDFDDDEALKEFLSVNPALGHSLITKGKRGANIWLKLTDDYPTTYKFKRNDKPAGEWRADRNQTIITGSHKDGGEYKIIVKKPPISFTYNEINWGEIQKSSVCHINNTDHSETQILKITQKKKEEERPRQLLAEKVLAAESAHEELKQNPRLDKLYRKFIERRFTAQQGERNAQLVAMTTFLFRAFSEETTAALVMFFYDLNQYTFSDSRDTHEKEMRSHLAATRTSWLGSLSKQEMEHFQALIEISPNHASAFRVCRELAKEVGIFFLSCAQLAERIGIDRQVAYRILRQFAELGIIEVKKKGTQHRTIDKVVTRGEATTYRWLLSKP